MHVRGKITEPEKKKMQLDVEVSLDIKVTPGGWLLQKVQQPARKSKLENGLIVWDYLLKIIPSPQGFHTFSREQPPPITLLISKITPICVENDHYKGSSDNFLRI